MNELTVRCPDFEPDGWIPERFCGYGEDKSPELRISGLSPHAVALAVTLDDLSHPIFPGYNHWLAWNLPPVDVIASGLPGGAVVESPFHMEQGVGYGFHRYRGPKPPFNWNHRYRFTVYALDVLLSLDTKSDKAALLSAMEGHILQSGCLFGKYRRHHEDEAPKPAASAEDTPLTAEMITEMKRSVKKNKDGRYIFDPKKPYGSVDNPVRVGMPDGVEVLVYDGANKRWILTDGLGNGWIR